MKQDVFIYRSRRASPARLTLEQTALFQPLTQEFHILRSNMDEKVGTSQMPGSAMESQSSTNIGVDVLPPKPRFVILRWIVIVPACFLSMFLAYFVVKAANSRFDGWSWLTDLCVEFSASGVSGVMFAYCARSVAPSHKFAAALSAFGVVCVLGGANVALTIARGTAVPWASGIGMVLGSGAVVYSLWQEVSQTDETVFGGG